MGSIISSTINTDDDLRDDGAFVFHHPPKFLWDRDPSPESIGNNKWGKYHLYIHVPFCKRICTFCTFERRQLKKGSISWFTNLLDKEIDLYRDLDDFDNAEIESIYLGGGTASLLNSDEIAHIIYRSKKELGLSLDNNTEITLETEPGTKSLSDLKKIRESGVNRISIGAQSFNDNHLKNLNRSHSSKQTFEVIESAKKAGFENIHIDIMYGLPGQTLEQWKETVDQTLKLSPTHVSAYPLIVFQGELLERSLHKGAMDARPTPDKLFSMREYLRENFHKAGLFEYSTAEFCRPGFECRYVRSTWDSSDYLGFGPGAYSRKGNAIWENSVIHPAYERSIKDACKPIGKMRLMSPKEQLQRDIAMGLCLFEVDVNKLASKSGAESSRELGKVIDSLVERQLILSEGHSIRLTELGKRYATYVMKSFTDF